MTRLLALVSKPPGLAPGQRFRLEQWAPLLEGDENGLLAGSADGWVEALERLAADPALRRRLGAAGRKTVEERYSSRIGAAQFADVARRALQRRARSSVRASEATVR